MTQILPFNYMFTKYFFHRYVICTTFYHLFHYNKTCCHGTSEVTIKYLAKMDHYQTTTNCNKTSMMYISISVAPIPEPPPSSFTASLCYDITGVANFYFRCPHLTTIHVLTTLTGRSRSHRCSYQPFDCAHQYTDLSDCNGRQQCSVDVVHQSNLDECGIEGIPFFQVEYQCLTCKDNMLELWLRWTDFVSWSSYLSNVKHRLCLNCLKKPEYVLASNTIPACWNVKGS